MTHLTIVGVIILSGLFSQWTLAASVEEIALYNKPDRQ